MLTVPIIKNGPSVDGIYTETEGAKAMTYRDIFLRGEYDVGVTYNDVFPGGNSKDHFHPGFHVTYIVSGEGMLKSGDEFFPLKAGDIIYLQDNEPHCYINTGKEVLRLLGIK